MQGRQGKFWHSSDRKVAGQTPVDSLELHLAMEFRRLYPDGFSRNYSRRYTRRSWQRVCAFAKAAVWTKKRGEALGSLKPQCCGRTARVEDSSATQYPPTEVEAQTARKIECGHR